MSPEALADRLVNYADAVAAFSVVNSIAFVVTLTEGDIRCSISHLMWLVVGGQISFSLIVSMGVVFLRHLECSVRNAGDAPTPVVTKYLRGFFVARLVVIAFSTLATVGFAVMALSDPGCLSPAT